MMRNSLVLASLGAVFALGVAGYGCSSSSDNGGTGGKINTTTGTGGSTTTTGTGGSTTTTGTGGSTTTTGTGGSTTTTGSGGSTTTTGTGGATGGTAPCAAPNPTSPGDGTACNVAITCTKNCGPNTSALGPMRPAKACTCSAPGSTWMCDSAAGSCVWPAALAAMSCFSLTPAPPLCPMDTSTTPATLIRANVTTCTPATGCTGICGSPTVASYLDSVPAMKMGYCVCINGVYRCASAAEWAPQ